MYHPFLNGDRVYLRGLEQKDLEGKYFDWLNDTEVTRYMDSGYFPNTLENMQEYLKATHNNNNAILAIIDKETETHIGNVRVGPINWIHRNAYIGILIGEKSFWCRREGKAVIYRMADEHISALMGTALEHSCEV
jgi:RimJ/RimL family protein N-acetyltransferase